MAVKVGINGFGRIGRQVIKAILEHHPDELEVAAFNDIFDLKTMAHLLKYDTNYGRFPGTVEVDGDCLVINGKKVQAFKETDPANIPWSSVGADIVNESSGLSKVEEDGVARNGKSVEAAVHDNTEGGAD